jgi:O-antigen/teichoic acid export membrane protein
MSSFAAASISALILYFVLSDLPLLSRLTVASLSVWPILGYPLQVIAEHYFVVTDKPTPLVIRNLGASFVNITVSFISIKYLDMGFVGWVLGSAIAAIVLAGSYIGPICINLGIRPVAECSRLRIKRFLRISLPIVPHSVGNALLASSDRVVLGILSVSIADIGVYSNGYQMGTVIAPIAGGLAASMAPIIQKYFRSYDRERFQSLFRFSHLAIQLLAFGTSLWMPQIYKVLVRNQSLHAAIPTAIIATYTVSTSIIYNCFAAIVLIQKKTCNILWLVLVPAIINMVLNLVLVPKFGFVVAATTTVLAQLTICALPILHPYFKAEVRKYMGSALPLIYLTPVITISSMSLVFFYFSNFGVSSKILLSLFAGVIFLLSDGRHRYDNNRAILAAKYSKLRYLINRLRGKNV